MKDNQLPPLRRRNAVFSWTRAAMHFPHGLLIAWCCTFLPVLAMIIAVVLLAYEITEDWRICDQAYIDIIGTLAGLIVMALVIGLWDPHWLTFWR